MDYSCGNKFPRIMENKIKLRYLITLPSSQHNNKTSSNKVNWFSPQPLNLEQKKTVHQQAARI